MGLAICDGSIDWVATGSMLQGLGTCFGAIAVLIAAKFGRDAVSDWVHQKQIEHAINAADRVLTAAYDVKSAIDGIRANFMSASELGQAEQKLIEIGADKALIDKNRWDRMVTAQTVFNRLNFHAPSFQELGKVVPVAKAYFGNKSEEALLEMARQRVVVALAAEAWIDEDGADVDFKKDLASELWRGHGKSAETDKVANAIKYQIEILDRMLLPVLRSDRVAIERSLTS